MTSERIKWTYVTHAFSPNALAGRERLLKNPLVADVVICRVLTLGKHTRVDDRRGYPVSLFPGDLVACAFGNRYATDQYEGYVPPAREQYHMLSVGGVCGMVGSKNERMPDPTVLEFLGYAMDSDGHVVNLRDYRLKPAPVPEGAKRPTTVLVVGASMNSGKTTTAAMAIRGLSRAGHKVVAAKLTGTGAIKDLSFMADAGAEKVIDFTHYGCPSTYRVSLRKLLRLCRVLRSHLVAEQPDYIVYEVADGIYQRETALLLDSDEFRSTVDHVLFAAVDALSAESGHRALADHGFHLVGFSGVVSSSELGKKEVQSATGLPCLSSAELSSGGVVTLLSDTPRTRRKKAV
jgi:hypothetical protein